MARRLKGIGLCLVACIFSALGTILQQRFLQSAGAGVVVMLPSVKLLYQHLIGFVLMLVALFSQPAAVKVILEKGFFHGWNETTVCASVAMWLSFFVASSVTAYVSAMAGAMGSAVVVIVVGLCGSLVEGHPMSTVQIAVICVIAFTTTTYTYLKFQMQAAKEAELAAGGLKAPLLQK